MTAPRSAVRDRLSGKAPPRSTAVITASVRLKVSVTRSITLHHVRHHVNLTPCFHFGGCALRPVFRRWSVRGLAAAVRRRLRRRVRLVPPRASTAGLRGCRTIRPRLPCTPPASSGRSGAACGRCFPRGVDVRAVPARVKVPRRLLAHVLAEGTPEASSRRPGGRRGYTSAPSHGRGARGFHSAAAVELSRVCSAGR